MGDNREPSVRRAEPTVRRRIGAYDAVLDTIVVGDERIALWQVDDLERHVDRRALLADDDAAEPPYWAHCWSGAHVLAAAVPARAGRVLELGCGLGVPGLVAARRGARVTFVDRDPTALAFVRASVAANGFEAVADCVLMDAAQSALRGVFDVVLAAELLYDRAAFPLLARALAAAMAPDGVALLTDAGRIDTRGFYPHLDALGLRVEVTASIVHEDRVPVTVRLVRIRHAAR